MVRVLSTERDFCPILRLKNWHGPGSCRGAADRSRPRMGGPRLPRPKGAIFQSHQARRQRTQNRGGKTRCWPESGIGLPDCVAGLRRHAIRRMSGFSRMSYTGRQRIKSGNVLSVIMGGGQGTRLFPLTKERAKPAVPLAGKYRLVDIPISNCINSGFRRIYVLTQFNSASLHRHISQSYKFDHFTRRICGNPRDRTDLYGYLLCPGNGRRGA
jgi:hypothetical protein